MITQAYCHIPAGLYEVGPDEEMMADYLEKGAVFYILKTKEKAYYPAFTIRMFPALVSELQEFIELHPPSRRKGFRALNDVLVGQHPLSPARGITHREAAAFAAWKGGRLPTVREWLVATKGCESRWAALSEAAQANLLGRKAPKQANVRMEPASDFGLRQVVGGVLEWCSDIHRGKNLLKGSPFNSRSSMLIDEVAYWPQTRPFNAGVRYVVGS